MEYSEDVADQRVRNKGIVPNRVSESTKYLTVAIAGVGGVGGLTAVNLVRQVHLKCIKLADNDTFDHSNLNRQEGAYHSTIGKDKVHEIAARCRDIDPNLIVVTFDKGVHGENIDEFLKGVDLLVNAVDYAAPDIYLNLTRKATAAHIPIIVGAEVGYGARAVWFQPGGMTYEEYFGLDDGDELDLRRLIMFLPRYADPVALRSVLKEGNPAPAIATGGLLTAGILVPWIEAILAKHELPKPAPHSFIIDVKDGKSGYIRFPRFSFYLSLVRMLVRRAIKRRPA